MTEGFVRLRCMFCEQPFGWIPIEADEGDELFAACDLCGEAKFDTCDHSECSDIRYHKDDLTVVCEQPQTWNSPAEYTTLCQEHRPCEMGDEDRDWDWDVADREANHDPD